MGLILVGTVSLVRRLSSPSPTTSMSSPSPSSSASSPSSSPTNGVNGVNGEWWMVKTSDQAIKIPCDRSYLYTDSINIYLHWSHPVPCRLLHPCQFLLLHPAIYETRKKAKKRANNQGSFRVIFCYSVKVLTCPLRLRWLITLYVLCKWPDSTSAGSSTVTLLFRRLVLLPVLDKLPVSCSSTGCSCPSSFSPAASSPSSFSIVVKLSASAKLSTAMAKKTFSRMSEEGYKDARIQRQSTNISKKVPSQTEFSEKKQATKLGPSVLNFL